MSFVRSARLPRESPIAPKMALPERWKVVFGARRVGCQALSMSNTGKSGRSCFLTIKKSLHAVCQIFPRSVPCPRLTAVGFDPLVEDFELVEQFRDTASEMQHPLEQVGVPPNAIQPVLSIMAKHLNKIVSRHDIKPEESSGLGDIIDIPMKLHKPRANLIDTDLNRITTRALLPDDSWSSPDLGIIGADIPSDLFTELLVDNLGALNPREANTAGSVEPIEPSTALRRVSREVHSPSPTPSINLDDFINVENNFTLVGTSSESPPLSWAGSFGSSPGVDGPMPIDPMFGK